MRLEHLIADIDEAVYEKIMSNRTVEETEARDTAKIVGLAAALRAVTAEDICAAARGVRPDTVYTLEEA